MPKDATPSLPVAGPNRTSGRVTRLPHRFRQQDVTMTSYMPSLSAGGPILKNEDVVEAAPTSAAHGKMEQDDASRAPSETASLLTSRVLRNNDMEVDVLGDTNDLTVKMEDGEDREALRDQEPEFTAPQSAGAASSIKLEEIDQAQGLSENTEPNGNSNRGLGNGRIDEVQERLRLEHAIETIDALNERICKQERVEERLKKRLRDEKERLKNSKVDAEGALNLLVLAEEQLMEVQALMGTLRGDVSRYRSWWLTEYFSLKALLGMLPAEQRDDARAIVEAAEARFTTYSSM